MSIGRIPMPQNGMDAFLTGMTQSQSMFDTMMKNQMRPYQMQLLKAQAQEAQAKASLLPQQMNLLQQMMGGGGGGTSKPTGSETPGAFDQSGNATTYNSATQTPNPSPAPAIGGFGGGPDETTPQSPEDASGMNRKSLVARANQDQASYDQKNGVTQPSLVSQAVAANGAVAPKSQAVAPNAPNAQVTTQNQNEPKKDPLLGKEIEITPGNPSMALADKMAVSGGSMNVNGMSVAPKIGRTSADGVETARYPSGRVTVTKKEPSFAEKAAITSDAKEQAALKVADKKETTNLENTAKSLIESAGYINNINDINKKRVTSGWYGLPGGGLVSNFSKNKDIGTIGGDTSLLQAAYAKAESTRGAGIGMVNFFKNTKPDLTKSPEVNQGLIESNARKVKLEFNLVKNDWERKNPGKSFPYQAPDFSNILTKTKFMDSNGKMQEVDSKNIDAARKIDPGLKVMGE